MSGAGGGGKLLAGERSAVSRERFVPVTRCGVAVRDGDNMPAAACAVLEPATGWQLSVR